MIDDSGLYSNMRIDTYFDQTQRIKWWKCVKKFESGEKVWFVCAIYHTSKCFCTCVSAACALACLTWKGLGQVGTDVCIPHHKYHVKPH